MKPDRPELAGLRRRFCSWFVGYAAALLAVTLVSLLIGLVPGQVNLANGSMVYLLAVMATAVGFGRGAAAALQGVAQRLRRELQVRSPVFVKGLVEGHGGRVLAENRAGGGARFTFTLPSNGAPAEAVSAEGRLP